jgi:hypothetical protein
MSEEVVVGGAVTHGSVSAAKLAVMAEVSYVEKKKSSKDLPYPFASEEAFIEALRPTMIRHGLEIAPVGVQHVVTDQYTTRNGANMNHVIGIFTFRLTHRDSETFQDVVVYGEGADNGDKSCNKAMTAAMKYALRQAFCIATGDDPDKTSSRGMERAEISVKVFNRRKEALLASKTLAKLAEYRSIYLKDGKNTKEQVDKLEAVYHQCVERLGKDGQT